MPHNEEEGCGNYDCTTCYPGGVRFLDKSPRECIVDLVKTYEM